MYSTSCLYPFQGCYGGFYPQDVGFHPLATGPAYVYPEQAMVMLGLSPGANTDTWYAVSYKPKMVLGTTGALGTGGGGASEMWLWSSNPTDNSSLDTGYPGLKMPNGTVLDSAAFGLPSHASYAIDGLTNATSFYQLGGLPMSSQFPYINNPAFYTTNLSTIAGINNFMNPYEVQAKGNYNSGANSWTVEFVRALTTSSANGENAYQLQMDTKNPHNYHIAFAVSQGQASQTYLIYYNSVSFWWSFNFVSSSGFNNPQYPSSSSAPLSSLIVAIFLLAFVGRKTVFAPERNALWRIRV